MTRNRAQELACYRRRMSDLERDGIAQVPVEGEPRTVGESVACSAAIRQATEQLRARHQRGLVGYEEESCVDPPAFALRTVGGRLQYESRGA
jgi:hypothetical protein